MKNFALIYVYNICWRKPNIINWDKSTIKFNFIRKSLQNHYGKEVISTIHILKFSLKTQFTIKGLNITTTIIPRYKFMHCFLTTS